jgi:hypothetical protein
VSFSRLPLSILNQAQKNGIALEEFRQRGDYETKFIAVLKILKMIWKQPFW